MSIALRCVCGTTLRTGDGNAGKRVRCPKCSALIPVPAQGITTAPGAEPPPPAAPEPLSMDMVLAGPPPGDDDIAVAEVVEDEEDVKSVELAEDDDFEVLEGERDLPEVRRARRRRRTESVPRGPTRRSPEHDLYDRPPSFLGMDVGGVGKTLVVFFAVFVLCCCVSCLVLNVLGRLLRAFG
jgi:hypothetical protein